MAILGIDLDGVCADYVSSLRTHLAEIFEIDPVAAEEEFPFPTDYSFSTWARIGKEFKNFHARAVDLGMYETMPAIEGASETLWKLNNEGHHIRIITSRFVKHGQHNKVVASTALWLDRNDIPYRDIMFIKDKPDVYADIYIDDAPVNIVGLRAAGRTVITFDTLYNKEMDGLRAYNWDDVYKMIHELHAPPSPYVLEDNILY